MADKISASITYLDASNNKGSKAITDISPTADNGAIKDFCVGLLGLTTNTLSQIDRVEKTDITNATTKQKLTLTLPQASKLNLTSLSTDSNPEYALFNQENLPTFVYRIDEPRDFYNSRIAITVYRAGIGSISDPTYLVRIVALLQEVPEDEGTVTVTVYFDETETTAATTAQVTIPITGDATLTIL